VKKVGFCVETKISPLSPRNYSDGNSLRLLGLLSLTIFIVEAVIMFGLGHADISEGVAAIFGVGHSDIHETAFAAFADAFFLTVIVFPVLYLFVFRKLVEKNRELADSEARLEQRVEERTGELEQAVKRSNRHRREITALNEMGHLFQACRTPDETHLVAKDQLSQLFPELSGSLYLIDPSRNVLEKVAEWGEPTKWQACVPADECLALRYGEPHEVVNANGKIICSQIDATGNQRHLCLPLTAQNEALGVLHLKAPFDPGTEENDQAAQDRMQFYGAVTENLALAIANLRLRETLQQQAIKDPLTGLYNRRYLVDALEREIHRAARREQPLSIIMLDIDHFKQFNDASGHAAGDTVLTELGALLRKWTREEDVVSRYGGEEFVAILPGADHETALSRAESLRKEVESRAITHQGQSLGLVTISAGVAVYPVHGMDKDALVHAADQAMYRSKQNGRNLVTLAPDSEGETRQSPEEHPLKLSA
jgi:diguanylate cyclase (GGDEF)-like protein